MSFDVFLSHNSKDKPAVKLLCIALKQRGLSVWFDEEQLRPGLEWQDDLQDIITGCKSAIVCFGSSGVGRWEEPEVKALIRRQVNEKKNKKKLPIIPVLLQGAPPNLEDLDLPIFLEGNGWVDLRSGLTPERVRQLQWGITGVKPDEDTPPLSLAENTPTVCLAKVTPELRKARETVVNYLTSDKLNVLPAKPYSSDPGKFLTTLEADLEQSDVFVQILGANYSERTEEFPEGEEFAQLQRAQNSGKVILQWRDKSVDLDTIDDPPHRELVGGANVVCNDLPEFAKLVAERAKRVHEVGQPAAADGQQRLALIKADKPDKVVADEVSQALLSDNVNCRVTSAGKSLVDTLREVPYDAILIVYGSCTDDWLEQRGDELMAVDLNLKDLAPVRAYYICADEPRLPYLSKAVLQIKRRDQSGWQQLITAIQKRGNRS